jgi:hypothetical protein
MSESRKTEDNEIRIARYLEDKMTPGEEEEFVRDLGADETLRHQYEEELLMQALWEEKGRAGSEEPDWLLQGADEHVEMVESVLAETDGRGRLRRMPAYIRWGLAAAAVLLVVVVASVLLRREKPPTEQAGGGRKPIDTPRRGPDSSVRAPRVPGGGGGPDLAGLYAHFYSRYSSGNIPVEISDYYNDYRDGDLAAVLAVKPTEYQSMGGGSKHALLQHYMWLLKGVSYLGLNQPGKADRQFDSVIQAGGRGTEPYYGAQWYDALAWLKMGDTAKALKMATGAATGGSVYMERARALVDSLRK